MLTGAYRRRLTPHLACRRSTRAQLRPQISIRRLLTTWLPAFRVIVSSVIPIARVVPLLGETSGEPGSGGPGEFHPRAPADPGVTLSRHRALLALAVRLASTRHRLPSAS